MAEPAQNSPSDRLTSTLLLSVLAVMALLGAGLVAVILRGCNSDAAETAPTPVPTVAITIQGLVPVAELATVKYLTVAEVHNERIPDDFRQVLGIKEELLLLVYGDVKAGFDLSKLTQDDLQVDGQRVRLVLPAPEILSVTLDQERTHVVYYRDSILMDSGVDLVQQAYQLADEAVRREAERAGILDQAAAFGRAYFENHLRHLGFTDVEVIAR
jgi:hypothetical protein